MINEENKSSTPLNSVSTFVSEISDKFSELSLEQINYVYNSNNRFLDLIFDTDHNNFKFNESLDPLCIVDRHHKPVEFSFFSSKISVASISSNKLVVKYLDFSRVNKVSLNQFLTDTDWKLLLNSGDINANVESFYSVLDRGLQLFVPEKKRKIRISRPPFRANRSQYFKLKFLNCRKLFNSKDAYYYKQHQNRTAWSLKRDPKKFWKYVNSKRMNTGIPSTVVLGDMSATDPLLILNLFADMFSGVYDSGGGSRAVLPFL